MDVMKYELRVYIGAEKRENSWRGASWSVWSKFLLG